MRRRKDRTAWLNLSEGLEDGSSAGPVLQWIVGVGLAAMIAGYSVACMVRQRALFPRTRPIGIIEMQGTGAVAIGAIYLSAALFLHCHWFWGARRDFEGFAQLGKMACLVGFVGGVGYLIYNVLIVG